METDKAIDFRKDISVSLRFLFRKVIESSSLELKRTVLIYLQYYLINYDSILSSINGSYVDFYSKRELIDMCANLMIISFRGIISSLAQIFPILKIENQSDVFVYNEIADLGFTKLVVRYLGGRKNLIIEYTNVTVQFRTGPQVISTYHVIPIQVHEDVFRM